MLYLRGAYLRPLATFYTVDLTYSPGFLLLFWDTLQKVMLLSRFACTVTRNKLPY